MSNVIKLYSSPEDATKELLEYLSTNISAIEDIVCIISLTDSLAVLHNGPSVSTLCYMKEVLAREIRNELDED